MIFGFALGPRNEDEELSVENYANENSIPVKRFSRPSEVPSSWTPVGTIEWFLESTNWKTGVDNYPDFLHHCLKRRVGKTEEWPLNYKVFIKPADKLKRFNGFITTGTYKGKKKGPYYCSDIVHFTNEWRYYISNGKILGSSWYAGNDCNIPAPDLDELNIQWPEYWVGSADFGITKENGLCLVEAHEPFGVGNYLDPSDLSYAQWIIDGWEFLSNKYETHCDWCTEKYDCHHPEVTNIRCCKFFERFIRS